MAIVIFTVDSPTKRMDFCFIHALILLKMLETIRRTILIKIYHYCGYKEMVTHTKHNEELNKSKEDKIKQKNTMSVLLLKLPKEAEWQDAFYFALDLGLLI